jgi:aldose 1-epimerase
LRFDGGGDEWPWRYCAEQHFELKAAALSMSLAVENLSDTPMPALLGLHPYFFGGAGARLRARLPRVWRTDAAALPIEEVETPREWSFDIGRAVSTPPLDHCFAGWDGTAVLRWPDRTLTLHAENCAFLQMYVPAGRDFFCLEPQTSATGAVGRGEATLVAPGERLAMRLRLDCGTP